MDLSGIASMSFTLPSNPIGQKTTSAIAWTSRILASMSRSATSPPPQPAPQYCAILIFSAMFVHLSLLRYGHILRRLALHACLLDQSPPLQRDYVLHQLGLRYVRGLVQLVDRPRARLHLLEEHVPLELDRRG